MTALSNMTSPLDHKLYKRDFIGSEPDMAEYTDEGHIVKDFKISGTRIKICDDYCRDKTPEDIQYILDKIAFKAQSHLDMQKPQIKLSCNVESISNKGW